MADLLTRLQAIRRLARGYNSDGTLAAVEALIEDVESEPGRCWCGAALEMDGVTCPHRHLHKGVMQMDLTASIKHVEAAIEARLKAAAEDTTTDLAKLEGEIERLLDIGGRLADSNEAEVAATTSVPAPAGLQPLSDPESALASPQPTPADGAGYTSPEVGYVSPTTGTEAPAGM